MKIYIIGTGLIGGSLALAIKSIHKESQILGIDANENHLEEALELGIIDKKTTINEINTADFIILAVPVDIGLVILPEVLDKVETNTLVFDVGSTKWPICKVADTHAKRKHFMATHPIAGTEFSGPNAAFRSLFENKTNIICDIEKTSVMLQEKGLQLFRSLGMNLRYMPPKSHDKHMAYVSHLSHISSFMLGKTVIEKEREEQDIFDLAGSGFESTVRLAKSSPAMWTPIFKQNKKQVVRSLEEYIHNLTHFKELLETDNYEAVFTEMHNTNRIKEILNGTPLKKE